MKNHSKRFWFCLLASLALAPLLAQSAASAAEAKPAADKTGWYHDIVDVNFVKQYAVLPKRNDVLIIDSRPTARKYDKGHIPGAVSIPDSQFDKMKHLLPKDKSTLLIFYCGGTKCKLSHKSAGKAEKLGYKNIKVYANGYPDWVKNGNIASVSEAYVKKLIDTNAKVVIIDSRPKARKYDKGHIPGAISIPDKDFDKMTDKLPAEKSTPLLFYCGGYKCKLSDNSAQKAMKLGYTNVKTFAAGFPAWKKAYGKGMISTASAAAKPAIKAGAEEGTITVASLEKILKKNPESVVLVDVRDTEEFKQGTFKTAINIPINKLEKKIDTLPKNKPIVFFCGSGGRSGEAYDMVKMFRSDLEVYFLDAELSFNKDGSYVMVPHQG